MWSIRLAISFVGLLIYSEAVAAIAHVGSLGSANSISANHTQLVITTSATLEAGNCGLLLVAKDNLGTTDADHNEITGVTDSASNTYTQIAEFTNGQGAENSGETVGVFVVRAASQLTSGGTVTISYSANTDASAARFREFTCGAALELAGSIQTDTQSVTDPGSMSISGLSSLSRLYVRAIAEEHASGTELTPTTDFTATGVVLADNGSSSASMRIVGEFRINTSTGETSDPTTAAVDNVSVFVALQEQQTQRPIPPIVFQ